MNIVSLSIVSTLLVIIGTCSFSSSTPGNNVFAVEHSKYTNSKYAIEFDYPRDSVLTERNSNANLVYVNSLNPSIEDNIIIPIAAKFKDSNQAKINSCAQSYHNMIPKIYRDDESYWEGSNVACAYGLYNYKANIGDKNLDPLLRIQIEGEAQICMFDDHCMKKINQIIKGKIALPQSSTPYKPSTPTYPEPTERSIQKQSPQEEEQQIINLCVQNLNAEHLPIPCQNLTPKLKEKVKNEAQKLGVSAHKLDDYKNITITLPQVHQDNEEQPWEIGFCAKRVYYSNYLPPFCEDKWKEEIEIEVQKLKEKDPTGGYKGDLTKRDNKDDDDDKDKDDEDNDDD